MKIAVVGTGYVGLSIATLLAQKNEVIALDIVPEKVEMINNRVSPIEDDYIKKYFSKKKLNLKATLDYKEAFRKAKYIVICTPTNFNEKKNFFDTSSVQKTIENIIKSHIKATIVIKSTVPVGFVNNMKKKYCTDSIIFSPEFLREGKALYDNLYPSRIIVGGKNKSAKKFGRILKECSLKKNVVVKYMESTEAEAVKLFSNSYLALRVAYFNELDTYAELNGLDTNDIIEGVCLDPRIGNYYNNPSFGYGGYCLPKDTKQLLATFDKIPQNIIKAIVESNNTRKEHITKMILAKNVKVVGVYRLIMKTNSDNFRFSAIHDIITNLKRYDIKIIIYEPTLTSNTFNDCLIVNDFKTFKNMADLILINRLDSKTKNFKNKIYSRDIFQRD